jgi:hypothetical protein
MLEDSTAILQNIMYTISIWPSNSTNKYVYKNSKMCPCKNFYTNVHNVIIHNSYKMETTEISINLWMVKHTHVHLAKYCWITKRNEVVIHATTMEEPWRHSEGKEPVMKATSYISCKNCSKWVNPWKQKDSFCSQELGITTKWLGNEN